MPFLSIDGQRLYYKKHDAEAGHDITLLFIHGLGSSHSFYALIVPGCLKAGFACLTFDTPGSGLSRPAIHDRTASQLSEAVVAMVSRLKLRPESIVVIGHSMGAMVASELALRISIRGVILLGPVHPTPALADIFAQRIKKVHEDGLESLADTIPVAATGSKAKPIHRAFIRALILSQSPAGYISLCQTISNTEPTQYDAIHCPLLILAGEDDKTSPLTGCKTILESWGCEAAQKRLVVLEGVGHWHCIEAPDEAQHLILDFVASLE